MPARKTTATKKTAAKKTAAPKKSSSTTAPSSGAEQSAGEKIASAIRAGHLDDWLGQIDDALTARANQHLAENKKSAATKSTAKKVSPAPKKSAAPTPTVEPTAGTTYGVSAKFKPLAGAKVKFVRFKADTDGAKSVVEMVTDKPGNPKGKKVVIPTAALEESKAPRRAAKK